MQTQCQCVLYELHWYSLHHMFVLFVIATLDKVLLAFTSRIVVIPTYVINSEFVKRYCLTTQPQNLKIEGSLLYMMKWHFGNKIFVDLIRITQHVEGIEYINRKRQVKVDVYWRFANTFFTTSYFSLQKLVGNAYIDGLQLMYNVDYIDGKLPQPINRIFIHFI